MNDLFTTYPHTAPALLFGAFWLAGSLLCIHLGGGVPDVD